MLGGSSHDVDVVVAGGGPAGSTTASFLRRHGRSVLVLEREQFHAFTSASRCCRVLVRSGTSLGSKKMQRRFIVAGGALHPQRVRRAVHLLLLGSHPPGLSLRVRSSTRRVRSPAASNARGNWELTFAISTKSVTSASRAMAVVDVCAADGSTYTVRAQMFVDATGRDTLLGTRFGLKVSDELVTTNAACFTHYTNCNRQAGRDEGNITVVLFDGGWWWFIPFKGRDHFGRCGAAENTSR